MSRLNELIQELCPNGIEYKTLGDIATISRGGSFQKKDFTEYGIPCIHYGQIYTRYEEANKLLYVIASRAKSRLYLFSEKGRVYWDNGVRQYVDAFPTSTSSS